MVGEGTVDQYLYRIVAFLNKGCDVEPIGWTDEDSSRVAVDTYLAGGIDTADVYDCLAECVVEGEVLQVFHTA